MVILLTEGRDVEGEDRAKAAAGRVRPGLEAEMRGKGKKWGAPVYLRVFKAESELELWAKVEKAENYELLRTWPIHYFSGKLGPKLAEGDRQAPEGFYQITQASMNPNSSYHLSFNLGYPNEFDRAWGRTGSLLMVHGSTVSVGCFAMTDALIEPIYTLMAGALAGGQKQIEAHIFPFRMTKERMEMAVSEGSEWIAFWHMLKPAYDQFEKKRVPPVIKTEGNTYRVLTK